MRKNLNLILAGAMMLTALACQKGPMTSDGNAEESGVKEVTTQFVLNIAAAPSTKMTADVVQKNNNFRGIEHAVLYTYKTGITDAKPHVLSTNTAAEKKFDFGTFFANGGLDPDHNMDGSTGSTPGSKRVLQLSVPVGTDAVLFYGKATKTSGNLDEDYGATITMNLSETPKDTKFGVKKILDGKLPNSQITVADSYDATARLMIYLINDILSRKILKDSETYADKGWVLDEVTWGQYGHRYELDKYPTESRYTAAQCLNHPLQGLEEILGKCYYLFTYILPASSPTRPLGEYRAGSSAAVRSMIIDMYKVITAANSATPTTAYEANAKRMAKAILDRASLFFDTTNGDYNSVADIKQLLISYQLFDNNTWEANFGGAKDLNGYPFEDYGVPAGAAQLGFVVENTERPSGHPQAGTVAPTDEFFYYHPNKPLVNFQDMTTFEPKKYVFPAELMYTVNSPIRTTGSDVTISSYPDGVTPWNTDASWTGWTYPGKVEGSTRGVAVAHNINYGVALLKSSVIIADGVTAFQDNRAAITGMRGGTPEPNRTINVSDAQLQLRGILVGGVNPRMNWQFTRYYTSTGNHEGIGDLSVFDGVIYDHSLSSNTVPTPVAKPNYTLVYDNYNSSETALNQNDVYISLEFVNGGDAFYGRDNLIPSGGVFYLVAKLDKPTTDQANAIQWPTDHHIPPLWGVDGETVTSPNVKGDSKKIARVFIQDFVTTVVFKLNEDSLQHAYYSTPDLRASQMSLGLSVDLQWTPGLNYEIAL